MASFPLLLPLLTTSLLIMSTPSSSSIQTGFRVGITRVDHAQKFTRLQLLRRSIQRNKPRLQRLLAAAPPPSGRVEAPVYSGAGEFLMNVSIGTPAVPLSAIVDTGSDLIWTQCLPCLKCFSQPTPIFDPSKSSTSSNASCTSDLCKDLEVSECIAGVNGDSSCKYLYAYGDESSTQGYMAIETFTFDLNVTVPNLGFGCGVNNQGSGLAQGSGLVGLGRGALSLISQLGLTQFSYCLTSMGSDKASTILFGPLAHLNFTNKGYPRPDYATPLIQNPARPTFYYVNLKGITVGETLVPIPKAAFKVRDDGDSGGGVIVDSGTTLTYLEEEAFEAVKREFVAQMKLRVSKRSEDTGLDVCFDLPAKIDPSAIEVPKVKMHLEGVDLELPAENYVVTDAAAGLLCLAMAASNGISIIGNIQLQNYLLLHDLDRGTLSFIPTECDQLQL
ncbi:Nepenthesin [Bertholletia excelsa]